MIHYTIFNIDILFLTHPLVDYLMNGFLDFYPMTNRVKTPAY